MRKTLRFTCLTLLTVAVLVAAAVLGTLFAAAEPAPAGESTDPAAVTAAGVCGYRASWELCGGVLSVTGTGTVTSAPWSRYAASVTAVTVGEGITALPGSAFRGFTALETVSLPASLGSFGESGFAGCVSLASAVLPDGVRVLPANLFANCTSLEEVTLPAGLEKIGSGVFSGCRLLRSIRVSGAGYGGAVLPEGGTVLPEGIPSTVTVIGTDAFSGCAALERLALPAGLTYLGAGAFRGCVGLTEVTVPSGVTELAAEVFRGCVALRSVGLPATLRSVGDSAFRDCRALEAVSLAGVVRLESGAFRGCESLAALTLSGSPDLSPDAFAGCAALAGSRLMVSLAAGGLDDWMLGHPDYFALTGCAAVSLTEDGAPVTELVLPACLTEVGENAFRGFDGIRLVVIPDGVVSVGSGAFAGCRALETVIVTKEASFAPDALDADKQDTVVSGAELDGWVRYPGGVRYYEAGRPAEAWFTVGGRMYYATYEDKLVLSRSASIRGQYYLWDEEVGFVLADGPVRQGDASYLFRDGRLTFGWFTDGAGRRMYARFADGRVIEEDYVIGGRLYRWNETVGLVAVDGVLSVGGGSYLYCGGARSFGWFTDGAGRSRYALFADGRVLAEDYVIGGRLYRWDDERGLVAD